ncbi:hypothetical protein K505DRAFT_326434 [Melanomma pulvis-pyrius CBS 109.77]|uniref:DNA helicase n=1 Tax=Melanomma pulvis-pyrius CBS 109.77 TaxID=1314802 RepID=A0A6A6X6T9_9PLEO|nr:hypothetical protein K505DRAFT_326434 [Melanomma pulvis-pyrius CBS 109.77]
MEDVTLVKADPNSPPPDAAIALDESAAAHDDVAFHDNGALSIKPDEELAEENGVHGGATQRPAKRRKLEDLTPSRATPRAISPPWKQFAANGPTTVFDNGIRKSSRVNKDTPPPPPEPVKRSTRHAPKATQTNGTSKNGVKQNGPRVVSGPAALSKSASASAKKAAVPALKSPPSRKSERQKKASTTAVAASPALQGGVSESPRKRPVRGRRATQTSADELDEHMFTTPVSHHPSAFETPGDFHSPPPEGNSSGAPTRLRLRLRKPILPNRHPHHTAPPPKHPTFADWLQTDDPLEGEDGQKITQDKAEEEAKRRLRIVDAVENGVLSETRCSIFTPQAAEELPPQYSHWDHVVAHALHFNKLLKEENIYHRRVAKTLAKEALDYWKEKYKRKTQEEIDQEETDRAVLRYRQLIKDVKDSWANVRVEIDKERVAKWEEEQLQLGHKAMDDMFNQAQEILGRGVVDSASSLVSDDRETDLDEREFESGASDAPDEDDAENMSSSSDSDNDNENDEDAHLTAEQLQAKYGQLPDLPNESSEVEEGSEGDEEDLEDDLDERTPEPTPDRDSELEDANGFPANPYTATNGFHENEGNAGQEKANYIDPATIELEQVDKALLDSDDDGTNGSQSGSEEWGSDDESEDEDQTESGSEDGEDLGVMGFLNPSEIKKIKEAAKIAMTDANADAAQESRNNVNGGHDQQEVNDSDGSIETNGEPKLVPEIEEKPDETHDEVHTNGDMDIDVVGESEEIEEIVPEQTVSRSRSRRGSSPPRTEIPSLLRGTLREYQHGGLDWLANLYDSDTNGILADEMGLGKTIQTISLLAYIAVYREKWGPHLVVVPTSVMLNWEMEFKKWCPGFKILTYYGDINERKRKRTGWRTTGPDMYNVIITSYQLILQDAAAFKMRAWQYLVLDEAHNIKNFKSQRWQTMLNLRTERRLLLTGTPLQNNIDELWSLLYFLMPAGFAGEGRIAGLEEFTMALKNPTSQILEQGRQQLDAEAQKIVRKLHEVLRPYLLRRLKADVEKQMPGKYEHVVYCKLSRRQRQLYDGFMGRAATKEILSSGNYMSIINCLMSLRKVCNHPDLFETRAIVTSMAMPKSVAAAYEIKDFFIRKRMHEGTEAEKVNLEALNLVFARREQTSMLHARRAQQIRATRPLEDLIERQSRRLNQVSQPGASSIQSVLSAMAEREHVAVRDHLKSCLALTRSRTQFLPVYGKGLIKRLTMDYQDYTFGAQEESILIPPKIIAHPIAFPMANQLAASQVKQEFKDGRRGELGFRAARNPLLASQWYCQQSSLLQSLVPTLEQRAESLDSIITNFSCVTPAVAAEELAPLMLSKAGVAMVRSSEMAHTRDPFHESRIRQSIAFPDKRLLQYDCGKLQRLAVLLRDLQAGGHRALIFTQMTKVLDILEQFLNIHGYRYLRLDGATKVEQRQILTDRFNNDPRIPVFILSSRSGGLGINLTGADTVIFYDLDWNPAMDKQCQDRSHRIGQTRDVHIYKFVSEYTIEANILRKSNQKRLLDDVIIQKGDFTTDTFNRVTWRDALEDDNVAVGDEAGAAMDRVLGERAGLLGDAQVMSRVEDQEDRNAASVAQKEIVDEIHDDQVDFSESSAATPANAATRPGSEARQEEERSREAEKDRRHVDEYMLDLYREEYGKEPYKPPTDRQKKGRKGHDVHRTTRKKKY